MKIAGLGGFLGIIAGVILAQWIGNPSDAAYYSIVAFVGIAGSLVGALISRLRSSENSDDH